MSLVHSSHFGCGALEIYDPDAAVFTPMFTEAAATK